MTPTTKKTADEAGTSTTVQENFPKTSIIAYMGRTGDNTRHSFGTWSGEQMPTIY